jgi:predicted GNAT family N-acyltransferase
LQQEGMRRFPLRYSEKIRASQLVRLATQEDIVTISAIEEDSFPEDEKATLETIQMRYETAGKYFHVLVDEKNSGGEIIGYVNGTCIEENYITHESMETHNPNGSTLVLHSVTVKSSHRRQGQANFLLRAYLELMESQREINLILLLCKSNLCRFYSKCGFQMVGVSPVVHGQVSLASSHLWRSFLLLLFFIMA